VPPARRARALQGLVLALRLQPVRVRIQPAQDRLHGQSVPEDDRRAFRAHDCKGNAGSPVVPSTQPPYTTSQTYPTYLTYLALSALLLLTVLVYSSWCVNGFLNWDDPVNVTQNHAIRAVSATNVRTWFTAPLLGMYSPL